MLMAVASTGGGQERFPAVVRLQPIAAAVAVVDGSEASDGSSASALPGGADEMHAFGRTVHIEDDGHSTATEHVVLAEGDA
jgi:hypothetical protein